MLQDQPQGPALQGVRIQGFKTALDVVLELGQVNVIVGPNGAGKTNLMEALAVLGCAAAGSVDDRALRLRGVRPGVPARYLSALTSAPAGAALAVEAWSGEAHYRATLDRPRDRQGRWTIVREQVEHLGRTVARRAGIAGALLLPDPADGEAPISAELERSILPAVRSVHHLGAVAALADALSTYRIHSASGAGAGADVAGDHPFGVERRPDLWARVMAEACGILQWAELSPEGPASGSGLGLTDRYLRQDVGRISLVDVGSGTVHVLLILLLVMHPSAPPLFALRNFAHALDPRVASLLTGRMVERVLNHPARLQVILSTSNPAVLDALDLRDERVRLFVVNRNRAGATVVRRVPHTPAMDKLAEQGMKLSELWTGGALGGMPLL